MRAVFEKIFLATMGLMFVVYGLMVPFLNIAGTPASGNIVSVRREGGERDEVVPNRYTWSVTYEFTDSSGKARSGNTKVVGSSYNSGVSKGPVTVLYFKYIPFLNAMDGSGFFPLERIIILSVGILFIVLLFRNKVMRHQKA